MATSYYCANWDFDEQRWNVYDQTYCIHNVLASGGYGRPYSTSTQTRYLTTLMFPDEDNLALSSTKFEWWNWFTATKPPTRVAEKIRIDMDYDMKDEIERTAKVVGAQPVENTQPTEANIRVRFSVAEINSCEDLESFVYPPDLPFEIQMPQSNAQTIFPGAYSTYNNLGDKFEEDFGTPSLGRVKVPANSSGFAILTADKSDYTLPFTSTIIYDDGSSEQIRAGIMECSVLLQNFETTFEGEETILTE